MEHLSIKLIDSFDSHFYEVLFVDGTTKLFPSVTTILQAYPKPHLMKFRGEIGNNQADQLMNRGAKRGSSIHNAVEKMLNGAAILYDNGLGSISQREIDAYQLQYETVIMQDQIEYNQVFRIKQLFDMWQPEILATEQKIFDFDNEYAGTMDQVMRLRAGSYVINGLDYKIPETGVYVTDVKSGGFLDDSANYQTAAYAKAFLKTGVISKDEFKGTIILHCNSRGVKGIEGMSIKVRDRFDVDDDYIGFKVVHQLWKLTMNQRPKVWQMPNALIYRKG